MRTAIKNKTAERKRLNPVEVCMQCRVEPIKITLSNQGTSIGSETQALVNQKMVAMVKGTIQKHSSDPAVVRIIQEKMMGERMQKNLIQEKMQPMIMERMQNSVMNDATARKNLQSAVLKPNNQLPKS